MALRAMQSSQMFRGIVQSAGRLPVPTLAPVQHRCISHTHATADGTEGAAGKKTKPGVGKKVLAERLAAQESFKITPKIAMEIIDTLLDDIMLTVAEGETVTIPGFGTFKKRHRAARKGRNPSTGAELDIAAKDAPGFSAGTVFKGVVQVGSWEAYDAMVAKAKEAKKK